MVCGVVDMTIVRSGGEDTPLEAGCAAKLRPEERGRPYLGVALKAMRSNEGTMQSKAKTAQNNPGGETVCCLT